MLLINKGFSKISKKNSIITLNQKSPKNITKPRYTINLNETLSEGFWNFR